MGEVATRDTTKSELARMMVGREVTFRVPKARAHPGEPVLQVRQLAAVNNRGLPALRGVTFAVNRGEILGVAGVDGNGQTELIEVVAGLRHASSGTIEYAGHNLLPLSPRARRERGLAHVPADRLHMGVEPSCTLEENLILAKYYRPPLSRHQVLDTAAIERFAQALTERLKIVSSSTRQRASALSGGNMQKLVLARELDTGPLLLIAAQPTRGVDIQAIEEIHRQIVELRDEGCAILLVSTELDEILALSDRILVLYEGEVVGEFVGDAVSEVELGHYMLGAQRVGMATSSVGPGGIHPEGQA
jgi:simple sugar transport system ATP-binding protein